MLEGALRAGGGINEVLGEAMGDSRVDSRLGTRARLWLASRARQARRAEAWRTVAAC